MRKCGGKGVQLILMHDFLSDREQLALLEANMMLESLCEGAQIVPCCVVYLLDERAHTLVVIQESPCKLKALGASDGGKEMFFLESKMPIEGVSVFVRYASTESSKITFFRWEGR